MQQMPRFYFHQFTIRYSIPGPASYIGGLQVAQGAMDQKCGTLDIGQYIPSGLRNGPPMPSASLPLLYQRVGNGGSPLLVDKLVETGLENDLHRFRYLAWKSGSNFLSQVSASERVLKTSGRSFIGSPVGGLAVSPPTSTRIMRSTCSGYMAA